LVSKASAGAIEHLAVAKVANLAQTVQELQKQGVWVYAAEAGGQSYDKTDLTGPCALIFGSEGNGVSALLKQKCDAIISIPMRGQVNSLNVSTAASILLCEAARQHAVAREKKALPID
jgi:23S rRNA (guanosine2251-2'-O)-methyltransferase